MSVGQDLANLNTLSWGGGDDGDGGGGGLDGDDGGRGLGQLEQSQLGKRRHGGGGGGGGEDLHCDNCFEVDTELGGLGQLKQQAS